MGWLSKAMAAAEFAKMALRYADEAADVLEGLSDLKARRGQHAAAGDLQDSANRIRDLLRRG